MAVYGNSVLRETGIFNTNIIPIKEDNIFEMSTSVVYEEYLNCKSLLEACTNNSDKAILEAKVEVLYEVSIKDIIAKIKELWNRFKAWIKEKFNAIFKRKKDINKKSNDLLGKVKSKLSKMKSKHLNESSLLLENDESEVSKPSKEFNYYMWANADKNLGDFSRTRANDSISGLIELILNKPKKLKEAIDKDSSAVRAIYIDLIESNDKKADDFKEEIERVFLTKNNYGTRLYYYSDTWEDFINGIESYIKYTSQDIRIFESHINTINKSIAELEKNLTPNSSEIENQQIVSMYASVTSSAINDLKELLATISGKYDRLVEFQDYLNDKLEAVNKYFDYVIAKNL